MASSPSAASLLRGGRELPGVTGFGVCSACDISPPTRCERANTTECLPAGADGKRSHQIFGVAIIPICCAEVKAESRPLNVNSDHSGGRAGRIPTCVVSALGCRAWLAGFGWLVVLPETLKINTVAPAGLAAGLVGPPPPLGLVPGRHLYAQGWLPLEGSGTTDEAPVPSIVYEMMGESLSG